MSEPSSRRSGERHFRKKPVEIAAVHWTGENIEQVMVFMAPEKPIYMTGFSNADDIIGVETLEGRMVAQKGDWIIRGVKGELYPCKPDIFAATYDVVEPCSVCGGEPAHEDCGDNYRCHGCGTRVLKTTVGEV